MLSHILHYFDDLKDPRVDRTKLHPLTNIILIAICANICDADTWEEMEEFGKQRQEWFAQWLDLTNGIPSHDTFARVFARLDPKLFGECLQAITQALFNGITKRLSIDGKYLRHSFDTTEGKSAQVMLNVWANHQKMVLASIPVDVKSNEIKFIPELLAMLEITGAIISIDAMGCQTKITDLIVKQEADYVISLKGNQDTIHKAVKGYFEYAMEKNWEDRPHSYIETQERGHGRFEKRRCFVVHLSSLNGLWSDFQEKWSGLSSIICIESERIEHENDINRKKISKERRYYISSLSCEASVMLNHIRSHWGVENSLHYVLDIAFHEDDSRIRKDHAPANMSLVRQMSLNLLKKEKSCKRGIAGKRKKAGWSTDYLELVLSKIPDVA